MGLLCFGRDPRFQDHRKSSSWKTKEAAHDSGSKATADQSHQRRSESRMATVYLVNDVPGERRLPGSGWKGLLAKLAKTKKQRATNRDVRFLVQTPADCRCIRTQRIKAMDQLIACPRISGIAGFQGFLLWVF
jgi:hypothetical protein